MTQDILLIHGGDMFETREEFLEHLKQKEVTRERLMRVGWNKTLQGRLGEGFDVLRPDMPNKQNARYDEWKTWFERIIPLLNPNPVLIGHSLGGLFLAKYLSEETFPMPIKATILIAAPYATSTHAFTEGEDGYLADFILPDSLDGLKRQGGVLTIYHSTDDHVVPYSSGENYRSALPSATFIPFTDRGHFNQDVFPEIEDLLRRLTKSS